MAVDHLLQALADGKFHSGEDLAQQQSISRAAIWKQIASLAELGVDVERRRGLGYRIPGGLDLLSEPRIRQLLTPGAAQVLDQLEIFREIGSTNEHLLTTPASGTGRGRVALAERQVQGRGRRGKHWVSPFGCNIYLSLDWQFAAGVQAIEGLSLAVGVAVVEALRECGAPGVLLKWPNDLLWEGRKLGGILVELVGDADGPCRAVVGIGINVSMPRQPADRIDQAWADLSVAVGETRIDRNALAATLVNHGLALLAAYADGGFAAWRDRWLALDAFAGEPVTLLNGDRKTLGIARGVDDRGALLLETGSGTLPVSGGEVSLRSQS